MDAYAQFDFVYPALAYVLALVQNSPKSVCVILDIDDTVLYGSATEKVRAIPIVHKFYQQLVKYETQIFFITARKFSITNMNVTADHLQKTGYDKFDGLFLMPVHKRSKKSALDVARFKSCVRDWLASTKQKSIGVIVGNTWQDLFSAEEMVTNRRYLKDLSVDKTYLFFCCKYCKVKLPLVYGRKEYTQTEWSPGYMFSSPKK